ncbi:sigma-70 family RNA polymerase sigma factor [Aminipila butyrica]|uniref:Sigma-70 family RNA polymerase sigma factor n=1 Tax=Aminipila butyrica TaxID=433296 RepID=A0A858C1B1_9FIRM|nr:sigma-70 family RNA polymerase sigma factor [Aminipila butyrica]QIB70276.1 sigma-70 family RNA polymerase sigma factor [Aminipila butyrica]
MNEDQQLISLIRDNPQEGLSKAIELYGGTLKWIIIKILGNSSPQDVEECMSDVFVKLWQNIDSFKIERKVPLKSYLFGITRYTAIDYSRKNSTQMEFIPIEESEIGVSIDFTDELTKEHNCQILQEAIDELPEPDKKIFIHRYYLHQQINAIASRLSLSPKTVENKLYRGKQKLRQSLIERGIVL